MIDTDKYYGHTPAPWVAKHDLVETEAKYGGKHTHIINSDGWRVWLGESDDINDEPRDDIVNTTLVENSRFGSKKLGEADAQLIADAPLILEAYKQLRELLVKGSDDYTTSYMDLREIIEDVYWALIGDDVHYSESDGARIKYALGILSVVIG